jgi:hypothetical protein
MFNAVTVTCGNNSEPLDKAKHLFVERTPT